MEKVFGLELSLIFLVVTSLSIGATVAILILGITNKVLVKMGVRNIPRRPAQSALIVLGLMLSTTIIGASLGIGDTISHSIRKVALDSLGMVMKQLPHGVPTRTNQALLTPKRSI